MGFGWFSLVPLGCSLRHLEVDQRLAVWWMKERNPARLPIHKFAADLPTFRIVLSILSTRLKEGAKDNKRGPASESFSTVQSTPKTIGRTNFQPLARLLATFCLLPLGGDSAVAPTPLFLFPCLPACLQTLSIKTSTHPHSITHFLTSSHNPPTIRDHTVPVQLGARKKETKDFNQSTNRIHSPIVKKYFSPVVAGPEPYNRSWLGSKTLAHHLLQEVMLREDEKMTTDAISTGAEM